MRALALAVILCLPAAEARANAAFVPPLRLDVSPVTMVSGGQPSAGFHLTSGLHWASVSPNPKTWLDVGIGYLHEQLPRDDCPAPSTPCGAPAVTRPEPDPLLVHGAYLEFAKRMSGTRHERSWLGARAELLFARIDGSTRTGAGLTARAAWELFTTVKAGGGGGGVIGALSLGVFLEVGYRRLPSGERGVATMAGLSTRLPLLAAGH
jgi:hypothetical protein